MIAVIKTGGKEYIVREGQELKVEKLELDPGAKLELEAMLVADEEGKDVKVGKPFVAGAKVEAVIVEHGKAEKVAVVKYKPKVRYRRNVGHRQPFTKIKIEKIVA
ncbi:MAG: 50S ribosomal protein L21 [Candidatus Uhrbacteria bacterium GW2011_GWE2_45_35]|uniref:Large ribosomal subunit protein bL21 n=2 Tax=Candidatus Uhriibacteriota TaxID=1752732 RepID=A0A0G1JJG2_9BACT|nr:MAG: 50S ribosomal protein L21 [Candidatus Uhrbacteria bacterium GW2011_GWF2_44_350]KKU08552.1 MAG: 50S ribosomal protein L21 [Candidatus Uhrbacteria bacterium GW2011_GWE2_45_35]